VHLIDEVRKTTDAINKKVDDISEGN